MSFVMKSLKNLLLFPLHSFIHKDFHDVLDRMSLLNKLLFMMVHFVDKLNLWHRLPVFLGLLYLVVRRHLHQKYNLINVGRSNGKYNEGDASEFPFFGRNLMPVRQHEKFRDRERSVARYNEFRRRMLQIPITKWEDLTDDEEVIETLHEVYGDDVEQLDLLVGLMAEKKIKGFAISETAFFIFIIMAARRLEADKFFTSNYNEETYTEKGLEWVNTTESLKDVLDRHYPEMTEKWMNSNSAFSVWDSSPEPHNPIPLYFRIPQK